MNAEPTHTSAWYLDHVAADAERFAAVLDAGACGEPVPACPGWDVRQLAEHLGWVHRWAEFCAGHARPPSREEVAELEPYDPERPGPWMRAGAAQLVETLQALDPDAPTWHPFPVEHVAAVWPRRQAHETAMHRWDAERAVGRAATIDAQLAADGIDEYFEVVIPRRVGRGDLELPTGSLHAHCTDVDGEWLVWSEDGEFRMIRAHEKGDAALRGPAEAILLRLWGRDGARSDELDPIGDAAVLDAWLGIAGM